jgi:hypothetical protein
VKAPHIGVSSPLDNYHTPIRTISLSSPKLYACCSACQRLPGQAPEHISVELPETIAGEVVPGAANFLLPRLEGHSPAHHLWIVVPSLICNHISNPSRFRNKSIIAAHWQLAFQRELKLRLTKETAEFCTCRPQTLPWRYWALLSVPRVLFNQQLLSLQARSFTAYSDTVPDEF